MSPDETKDETPLRLRVDVLLGSRKGGYFLYHSLGSQEEEEEEEQG